ncbi:amidohydrolase [Proteus penneri]|uniref:N-substituted formamide deformylase n=1 Tax=Proteus penneri TaxID=102862 RepID=A0A0G4Q965_9GAMM|nr:amidohydrolase [Proteus penneri]CRL62502.1 N-substituted formamide deformylase precursor [Proteus penneri]
MNKTFATEIFINGEIHTLDRENPLAQAIAVHQGKFLFIGSNDEAMQFQNAETKIIDLKKHVIIPGLNDSHLHLIRGGLNYNLELRWEGVPSLSIALDMLKAQVQVTPSPQWVRVVGGWSEFQFAERRMPTLDEINAVSPDTPVFVLHLYDSALLNKAALRAIGYTKETPNPPGGEIQRDEHGNPTGLLIAKPNAMLLYSALAKGPKLPLEYQVNSTRQFMRELNRLGVTSAIDAGGGFQNYPEDYQVVDELAKNNQLTIRIAYNLFTQRPKQEFEDFQQWTSMVSPGDGSDFYRHNGAGEMLVFSAADFEDFLQPRPDLPENMEAELEKVIRHLVEHRWPFRLHATYNESINRMLDVFEKVNKEIPFDGLPWFFDHAETISEKNIERVKALGGGLAIQHRMAFQGEYFAQRYGTKALKQTPPIAKMLNAQVPVGLGTDATRVASYNPWTALYWLVSGRTVGGMQMYDGDNRLDRDTALMLWTMGSSWFSNEQGKKGQIKVGQFADFIALSADYFRVPENEIKAIESLLTVVDGKIVYANGDFSSLTPPSIPVLPDWSPVIKVPGHYSYLQQETKTAVLNQLHQCCGSCHVHGHQHDIARQSSIPVSDDNAFWGTLGCSCFAF